MTPSILPPAKDWRQLAPHPSTITYRRSGDVRVLVAAGYALLLQVSHPTVGAGVSEHSQFRRDPWGRLLRTLDYTCTMVYGGPQAAGEMGHRIRSFHKQIYGNGPDGRRYHALEPEAYAWVHATLAEAIVLAHERFGRPFDDDQRQRFWVEWRALGRLLGIRGRDLPADWGGFRDYFDEIVDNRLAHTAAVDEVLEALTRPMPPSMGALTRTMPASMGALTRPMPAPMGALGGPGWAVLRAPLGHALVLASVGMLSPALRRRFGVSWTRASELELRAISAGLRAITPLMPSWLLNTGPGYLRWREEAIARGDVASPELLA
jgi:uncharacterized protein (DUF2236 family)